MDIAKKKTKISFPMFVDDEKKKKLSAINVNFNQKSITKTRRDATTVVNQTRQQNCFISSDKQKKKTTRRKPRKKRSV